MAFVCSNCDYKMVKWMGKCPECSEFNTMVEVKERKKTKNTMVSSNSVITPIHEVKSDDGFKLDTTIFGKKLVAGSTSLVHGEPGSGKSTFLLQLSQKLNEYGPIIYISGEESMFQIKERAARISVNPDNLLLSNETNLEQVAMLAENHKPKVIILDSLQTLHTERANSSPGSPSQVKESAYFIQSVLKTMGITCIVVGHETKSNSMAGPNTVAHTFDTIISLARNQVNDLRVFSTTKNRFGALSSETYQMTEVGMIKTSPTNLIDAESRGFYTISETGEVIEVQALAENTAEYPKRVVYGYDKYRLEMLLKIGDRSAIPTQARDVFVEINGTNIDDGIELPILIAISDNIIPNREKCMNTFFIGRLSLDGRINTSNVTRKVNTILSMSPDFKVITGFIHKADYLGISDKSRVYTYKTILNLVKDLNK